MSGHRHRPRAAPAPCRCGHSRSYHRLRNDQHLECFASPMKAPPCRCAQYRPQES
jgi:hypothetical protein